MRGAKGASAQLAHSTRVMSIEYRTALLKEAGVLPSTPASGLAIKSDMNLPWNGLRKLHRYLKEFGVKLESEHVMRKQISKELPFDLLAEEVPLFDKNDSISMCPVVCFVNLIEVILHYISLNHKAGTLTWRNGSLPEDQIWVKLGGDHGGESFKFCFQIVNVSHPNALVNTVPFLPSAVKILRQTFKQCLSGIFLKCLLSKMGRLSGTKRHSKSLYSEITNFSRSRMASPGQVE